MGDQNTPLTEAEARHLLRRTGFGAPPAQVDALTNTPRGAAADALLAFTPSKFRPRGNDGYRLQDAWIRYMVGTSAPLQEKLVLFWHDHFATNNDKVGNPDQMSVQNQLLRRFCKGNFRDFVKEIGKNAAMMEFLDTVRNGKEEPNENYARELQELFTLGVQDFAGNDNYAQADIVQIARAFTGWSYDRKGTAVFYDYDHDYTGDWPERGAKVVYANRAPFGAGGADFSQPGGEGAAEIDRVVDLIFQHQDTDGKSTVARHIARKMITYFAYAAPATADVDAVVTASGFDVSWDIAALLRAIFVADFFFATAEPASTPYGPGTKKSVKWPIDYVVSTMRLLDMRFAGKSQYIKYSSYDPARAYLENMGQRLFHPPSVFGWDWESGWVSSATLLARYSFATDVARARGHGHSAFRPERLAGFVPLMSSGTPTPAPAIVDTATGALGITDQLTTAERDALIAYLGGLAASLDLNDYDVRNTKLHGLFALLLQSPAYQLH